MGWLCGCLLEFLKFFCGTKRLSSRIRFDLIGALADPWVSVVLKFTEVSEETEVFPWNQTGNIEIQKEQYTPRLGGKCSF